jgi:hypothetical protein
MKITRKFLFFMIFFVSLQDDQISPTDGIPLNVSQDNTMNFDDEDS